MTLLLLQVTLSSWNHSSFFLETWRYLAAWYRCMAGSCCHGMWNQTASSV